MNRRKQIEAQIAKNEEMIAELLEMRQDLAIELASLDFEEECGYERTYLYDINYADALNQLY